MPYIMRENLPDEKQNSEPNRRRSKVLKLRLTPSELEEINNFARKNRKSKTDSILSAIRNKHLILVKEMPEVLSELKKQGNNLNQAVKLAHINNSSNLQEINKALDACVETYEDLKVLCLEYNIKFKRTK